MSYQQAPAATTASHAWIGGLRTLLMNGVKVNPRGKETVELLHATLAVHMQLPVVLVRERRLNYSFAAAEALWILDGDNRVATLTQFNPRMAAFSDDGIVLDGAYGPRIIKQLDYVVANLLKDRVSRQAVLTTWERNPVPSKDVPCTISLQFTIRDRAERSFLDCHVSMRSSDIWLGVPYDVFSFSMVAARVACLYNRQAPTGVEMVELGTLHLTAGSSHLYAEHFDEAKRVLGSWSYDLPFVALEEEHGRRTLAQLVATGRWPEIRHSLEACRDKAEGDRLPTWRVRP